MPHRDVAWNYPVFLRAMPDPRVGCPRLTAPYAGSPHCWGFPRLACLIHAANVRSEPGSNPSRVYQPSPLREVSIRFEAAVVRSLLKVLSDQTSRSRTGRGKHRVRRTFGSTPHLQAPYQPPTCQRANSRQQVGGFTPATGCNFLPASSRRQGE